MKLEIKSILAIKYLQPVKDNKPVLAWTKVFGNEIIEFFDPNEQ